MYQVYMSSFSCLIHVEVFIYQRDNLDSTIFGIINVKVLRKYGYFPLYFQFIVISLVCCVSLSVHTLYLMEFSKNEEDVEGQIFLVVFSN